MKKKCFIIFMVIMITYIQSGYSQDYKCNKYFDIQISDQRVILKDKSINLKMKDPLDMQGQRVNLKSIKLTFKKDRSEIEDSIFTITELKKIKPFNPYVMIYINTENKLVESLCFVFRNMPKEELKSINIQKLKSYKEKLMRDIIIKELFFETNIIRHRYIIQSLRVFL